MFMAVKVYGSPTCIPCDLRSFVLAELKYPPVALVGERLEPAISPNDDRVVGHLEHFLVGERVAVGEVDAGAADRVAQSCGLHFSGVEGDFDVAGQPSVFDFQRRADRKSVV